MAKCTDDIRVHVPEELKLELYQLAEHADRSLSDYIRHVLSLHVYGHAAANGKNSEGPERDG